MVLSEDGFSKQPEHEAGYCKQKRNDLPIKLCWLISEVLLGSHTPQSCHVVCTYDKAQTDIIMTDIQM
jgi:hypothetical protein